MGAGDRREGGMKGRRKREGNREEEERGGVEEVEG